MLFLHRWGNWSPEGFSDEPQSTQLQVAEVGLNPMSPRLRNAWSIRPFCFFLVFEILSSFRGKEEIGTTYPCSDLVIYYMYLFIMEAVKLYLIPRNTLDMTTNEVFRWCHLINGILGRIYITWNGIGQKHWMWI